MLGTQTLAGTLLGTQTLADNDALSPGGTLLGTHALADTPQKKQKAWQYEATPSTTAGEAAELRKFNAQSIRNARKKARGAEESEEAPRDSLAVRALRVGIGQGEALGLGPERGPERDKAQKALSQKVRQAELSVAERDALNERRRDLSVDVRDALNALQIEHRAEQSVDARDALNARRRANEQVTISVRLALRALYTPVRLVFGVTISVRLALRALYTPVRLVFGVFSTTQTNNPFDF